MATEYTREWIKFFTGCGIPDDVATMYALIFYENRIQKNMLLDLNKEYLRDMGITVMGDVIAILRYAKLVHKKQVREQILLDDDDLSMDQKREPSLAPKKSPHVKRMLEHYTRKYNSLAVEKPKNIQLKISNSGTDLEMPTKYSPKQKIEIQPQKTGAKEKNIQLATPLKLRRILPEKQKGDYEIKMPVGTTERSKKILEQGKKREAKTVFDRLGESSVSSTTSEISSSNSFSTGSISGNPVGTIEKNPSVFSRLGEKTSIVSSTSSGDQSERLFNDQLPYVGILKTGPSQKKSFPTATMRADDEEQKSIVKTRLGLSSKEGQSANAPIRLETMLRRRENIAKTSLGKIKNVSESNSNAKDTNTKMAEVIKNRLKKQTVEGKAIVTESQIQSSGTKINLKRKLGSCDGIASKKVRFGSTTLRLIPPCSPCSPSSSQLALPPTGPADESKAYPRLTMIVSNGATIRGKSQVPQSKSNSDRTRQKISLAAASGIKSFHQVLEKRRGESVPAQGSPPKKFCSIRDRLG